MDLRLNYPEVAPGTRWLGPRLDQWLGADRVIGVDILSFLQFTQNRSIESLLQTHERARRSGAVQHAVIDRDPNIQTSVASDQSVAQERSPDGQHLNDIPAHGRDHGHSESAQKLSAKLRDIEQQPPDRTPKKHGKMRKLYEMAKARDIFDGRLFGMTDPSPDLGER